MYHDFVNELEELGYHVWASPVFCPEYGMPQMRKRHVLLASRLGNIELVKPTHNSEGFRTVKDVIGKLPAIEAGEQHPKDRLHMSASLSPINLQRIQHSKPGGTWRDWPEDLVAKCHRKNSGKSYSGVYARMQWDEPSPTMTTQCFGYGNGRFGHPEQNRAISLREAAMLQTFPKSYKFIPNKEKISIGKIGKMIGNAVPVRLGKVIGKSIIDHTNQIAIEN